MDSLKELMAKKTNQINLIKEKLTIIYLILMKKKILLFV